MSVVTVPAPARGGLDVVYVLTLMQVAFLVLAGLGEVVLMGGNPAYLLLPIVKAVLLLWFATQALGRRRWALRALVVLAWVTLTGFALQLLIGLAAAVDFTVNLVGLLTNVGLPVAVILLCRPELRAIKRERRVARAQALPIVYPPVVHGPPRPATTTHPDPSTTARLDQPSGPGQQEVTATGVAPR